jgi:hypothetical protein
MMKLNIFFYTFLLKSEIKDKIKQKNNVFNKIFASLMLDDVININYYVWKLFLTCFFKILKEDVLHG